MFNKNNIFNFLVILFIISIGISLLTEIVYFVFLGVAFMIISVFVKRSIRLKNDTKSQ